MAWTSEQLQALYENIYGRRMKCPGCGGALGLITSGEKSAIGVVTCGVCGGQHQVAMDNDPLRASFRPYTEQEKRDIIAAEKRRKTPRCPVDATAMDVQLQRSLGRNSNVLIRCPRCAATAEYVRAHG